MSNWILYDDFVDLVRNHHHERFSGLITGVSDENHSFQIGFDNGEIVLLNYRLKKGQAALELLTHMERAKISEHPNSDVGGATGEVPDTSTVLSQLTANTLDETTTTTEIDDMPDPPQAAPGSSPRRLDARLRKIIETEAIHHFGPIGAMVCEERLANPDADLRSVVLGIAQDVGASEADTRAFFEAVSGR